jgi:hypothetical protein
MYASNERDTQMQVISDHLKHRLACVVAALVIGLSLIFVWSNAAQAAGVVGDGTPASCDGNAFASALTTSGTVTFNCGAAPHVIASNTNVIGAGISLTIDGNNKITLDGQDLRQLFIVTNGAELTLRNITLTGGASFNGGAVYVDTNGVLYVYKSILEENGADLDDGGAIYNKGLTDIEQSYVRYNEADRYGAGIYNEGSLSVRSSFLHNNVALAPVGTTADGGAIYNRGKLTITDSTFSRNRAERYGGAMHLVDGIVEITNSTIHENYAVRGAGINTGAADSVTILNVTLSRNNADQGANIWNGGNPMTLKNTIVAGGSTTADNGTPSLDCDGPSITSLGGNIIGDGSCIFPGLPSDQRNTDPKLTFIDDNGGFAPTVMVEQDSPAIDKGLNNGCPARDQRGVIRPQGDACDVGALELGIADEPNAIFLPMIEK